MLKNALKLLEEINSVGYRAYIVGGFVRDYILGIDSNDIDVTTNATPKELKEIFGDDCFVSEDYGSVTINKKGIRYQITTFRKEIGYIDNRRPAEIKYIDDLYQDLLRRDFTINTICMNGDGEIIDYLGGQDDLKHKIIRTVGNASERFEEDALRILRAVRFATVLGFDLDPEVVEAIGKNKCLLKKLSYYRKKEELDKIFVSARAKEGIDLLLKLGLDKSLELENLDKVKATNSLIGIWSVLNVTDNYPFTSNEKELITSVNEVLKLNNLDPVALYKYGLYVNSVAGEIKGLDIKNISEAYNSLVIKSRKDLDITSEDIMNILDKEPGSYLSDIYNDLERAVLYHKISNQKGILLDYVKEHYQGIC